MPAAGNRRRIVRPVALGAALLLVLAGCGGSGGTKAADPNDLAVAVASYDLASGAPTRFIVGLLTVDQRLIGYGSVDLRFSYVGAKSGSSSGAPGPVIKASYLPIYGSTIPSPPPVDPQIVLESDSRGVYGAQTTFDKAGFWEVQASATIAGKVRTGKGAFQVNATHAIPAPGDQAIPTDSLTLTSPDVPKAAVDSRAGSGGDVPDPDLHRTSIAAALAAHHPIVAVFATPVYCTSRFCGPITDMVNDLAHKYPDRADFIHVEIWRDFQGQVVNKSAADWLYRDNDLNEPWVFVIGADGKITARFDNVVTLDELEPLIQALPPMAAAGR
ncbi:MAG TPA: hypothetical protein VHT97_14825 [Acidimicrobiales bacterium]|nr:hypothetical protein [Acidimicrobiales bacterium]